MGFLQAFDRSPAELELATWLNGHTLTIFDRPNDIPLLYYRFPTMSITDTLQKVPYGAIIYSPLALLVVAKLFVFCPDSATTKQVQVSTAQTHASIL